MPIKKDQVTIVIPVLNEEKAIGLVLDEVKREGYRNILAIDGYSTDNTVKIVEEKGVKVIQQHGRGKTGATKTAIENVETPYLLIMDGDHTYCAEDIERFLNHGKGSTQIIGRRNRQTISRLHRLGNWVITTTFNLLMGTALSDVCSGMYLLNTEVARELELNSTGFRTEVEIATQTSMEQGVTEVPINLRRRVGKRKLSTWRQGFEILFTVIDLARRYNPVLLFSLVSALSIIPAAIVLSWVLVQTFTTGIWHTEWFLTSIMLLLFASQSIAVATISIILKKMERRIMRRLKLNKKSNASIDVLQSFG